MSLWGVHIGVAVIITSLFVGYVRPRRDIRWLFVWGNGVFATVPDWWWVFTDRFVPRIQNPAYAQAYKRLLHDSWPADVF